jgi:hypothetical protein
MSPVGVITLCPFACLSAARSFSLTFPSQGFFRPVQGLQCPSIGDSRMFNLAVPWTYQRLVIICLDLVLLDQIKVILCLKKKKYVHGQVENKIVCPYQQLKRNMLP